LLFYRKKENVDALSHENMLGVLTYQHNKTKAQAL